MTYIYNIYIYIIIYVLYLCLVTTLIIHLCKNKRLHTNG